MSKIRQPWRHEGVSGDFDRTDTLDQGKNSLFIFRVGVDFRAPTVESTLP